MEKSLEKRLSGTLRERGQITIPKEVREQAHLEDGAEVDFEVREPGEVVIRRRIAFDTLDIDAGFAASIMESTRAGYESLRSDPEEWGRELEERSVLDGATSDGLEGAV